MRTIVAIAASIALFFGLAGAPAEAGQIVVKLAHTDSDIRSTNVAALQFKKFMEDKTNGQVVVEVYPNGQLGDDDDLVKGIQFNTCQIYIGNLGVIAGQLGPKLDALILPFMYESYEQWIKGMFEKGGLELFNKQLAGTGYTNLDFQYDGMRCILTTGRPIRTLDSMKGLKIRVNNTDLYLTLYKAIGANPTPMAFGEVYTGLTQGAIDGVDHVLGVMVDQKFYEPAKYLTLTRHLMSPLVVLSSERFVNSLPADIKAIFMEGVKMMGETQRGLEYVEEGKCIEIMRENGLEIIELSAEERAKFVEAAKPVYDEWRKSVGNELMDQAFEIAGN